MMADGGELQGATRAGSEVMNALAEKVRAELTCSTNTRSLHV